VTVRLHRTVTGPAGAPALVLGSSLGTTHELWNVQIPLLSRHFRVIAFDLRGHGGSPSPPGPYTIDDLGADVLAMIDDLGLDRVAYAGLSIGAMIGMRVASAAPERISALALLCTSAKLGPAASWRERAAAVRAGGMAAIADAQTDQIVGRWFTPGFATRSPDVVARCRAMLRDAVPEGYAACCEAIATMDLLGDLSRIVAPTLVCAAASDLATPVEHSRAIVARIRDARLAIIDDAAHLANVEQPAKVSDLLLEHFSVSAPR